MAPFIPSLLSTGPQVGIFMGFTDPLATSLVAAAGYDFVIIDMEHNPLSAAGTTQTVHTVGAASKGKCSPLVRVPAHGVEWIKWGLDSGSAGLIIPMVQTSEDAANVVKRGRYPPLGERSFGPSHTVFAHAHLDHGVGGYFANARDEKTPGLALIPMLESKLGVQNADAIVGTDGISGAFIGPFDLRCSLGLQGGEGEEDLFVDALKAVAAAGRKHGKPVGMMSPSPRAVKQGVELGFTFIAYQGDSTLLGVAARASVREAREVIGGGAIVEMDGG